MEKGKRRKIEQSSNEHENCDTVEEILIRKRDNNEQSIDRLSDITVEEIETDLSCYEDVDQVTDIIEEQLSEREAERVETIVHEYEGKIANLEQICADLKGHNEELKIYLQEAIEKGNKASFSDE